MRGVMSSLTAGGCAKGIGGAVAEAVPDFIPSCLRFYGVVRGLGNGNLILGEAYSRSGCGGVSGDSRMSVIFMDAEGCGSLPPRAPCDHIKVRGQCLAFVRTVLLSTTLADHVFFMLLRLKLALLLFHLPFLIGKRKTSVLVTIVIKIRWYDYGSECCSCLLMRLYFFHLLL